MSSSYFSDRLVSFRVIEYYYGFVGVTLAWQFLFLVISSGPVRFRPVMLPAMLEKVGFAVAVPILYALDRVPLLLVGFSTTDATWLVLFIVCYLRTPATHSSPAG